MLKKLMICVFFCLSFTIVASDKPLIISKSASFKSVATESENHTELNVLDLPWMFTHLSLRRIQYSTDVYKKLEIKIRNAIYNQFGDKAVLVFKDKQESWSCDNCATAMQVCCLRMIRTSVTNLKDSI